MGEAAEVLYLQPPVPIPGFIPRVDKMHVGRSSKADILIAIIVAWAIALLALAAGVPLLPVIVLALIMSAGLFRALKNHNTQNTADPSHLYK